MTDNDTEVVTATERFWLWVMRRNARTGIEGIRKKWGLGRLEITFEWRSKANTWGRFGGGWNWKLGFMAGGSTVVLLLLFCTLRFAWRTP